MQSRFNIPLYLALFLFMWSHVTLRAQDRAELMGQLVDPIADSTRVNIYCELAVSYLPFNTDSAEFWLKKVEKAQDQEKWSDCYVKNDIELSFEVTDAPIDVDLAIPLGLIANELVSNSFKHAYKDVVSPKLHVALVKEEDLLLLVKDNGSGFKEKGEALEDVSFGMELVQSLSKQLKATLDYQLEAGTVVRMTIPQATLTKSNV